MSLSVCVSAADTLPAPGPSIWSDGGVGDQEAVYLEELADCLGWGSGEHPGCEGDEVRLMLHLRTLTRTHIQLVCEPQTFTAAFGQAINSSIKHACTVSNGWQAECKVTNVAQDADVLMCICKSPVA